MTKIPAAGCWMYYPAWQEAQNMHNGNWAAVVGRKVVVIYNCPAPYMLRDLANWLQQYWCFA